MMHGGQSKINICVIGAGVIGLSTAVQLQRRLDKKYHTITIIADRFNSETLSDGAGGIFRLSSSLSGPHSTSIREWGLYSFKHFTEIMHSDESAMAGVQEVSGYILTKNSKNQQKEMDFMKTFHRNLRAVSEDELIGFNGNWTAGIFFTTIVIDGSRYLPYLHDKFLKNGGRIVKRTIYKLEELANEHDIIVNCAGLGAAELADDNKLVPIRGQLIRVKAPWIKHFYYGDLDTYIIPITDTIAIGGTRQFHSYNTDVDRRDSEGIWERCCNIMPSLKDAVIVKEWVGLRPHRDPIRVEADHQLIVNGKQLNVVHNYGHGGYGITLSWGSAKEAVDLIEQIIDLQQQYQSKL